MYSTMSNLPAAANRAAIVPPHDQVDDLENGGALLLPRFAQEGSGVRCFDAAERVEQAMIFHGASPQLIGQILTLGDGIDSASQFLSSSLGKLLNFSSLFRSAESRIMLAGAPGVGKSSMIAKLTAAAPNRVPQVFTTDTSRPGGAMRLIEYLGTLDVQPRLIRRLDTDFSIPDDVSGPILIDTAGIDAADDVQLRALGDLASAMSAEPVLVISALSDPAEARDLAHAMLELGATKLLVTRLDMARRLGAVIAAAEVGLAICHGSVTSNFAYGLTPLSPLLFADRLLKLANTIEDWQARHTKDNFGVR